MKLKIIYFIVD